MRHRALVGLGALLAATQVWAGVTYMVTTDADSGPGSLRARILEANATGLGDTITFQQAMVIYPLTPLPPLTGLGDTLNGDLNADGNPDVLLNGSQLSAPYANGLEIGPAAASAGAALADLLPPNLAPPMSTGTKVVGLCIQDCPSCGIWIHSRGGNTVRSCYLGVTLFGDGARPNGVAGILLQNCSGNTIGGTVAKYRNLFTTGASLGGVSYSGLAIDHSDNNRVLGNSFGLDWSGMYGIGQGDWHVQVSFGEGNQIGGTDAVDRNLFAGSYSGVRIYGASANKVQGNWFGLGSNGNKALPLTTHMLVMYSSPQNVIGGTTEGAGNVFGPASQGVHFADAGTADSLVQGNAFGCNAAGTAGRALETGVLVNSGAGAQTIGPGNHFTISGATQPGVVISGGAGAESVVTGNAFGVLPNGTPVDSYCGVSIARVRVFVTDNVFARNETGVKTVSLGANARVFRNVFRACQKGVWIRSGFAMMGNLGNSETDDDGGNQFRTTNTWHIYNSTESGLRAEGNDFGTTVTKAVDAKIHDEKDDPNTGRIDFVPLAGGVIPTGETSVAGAVLSDVAAVPTRGGAEIAFTLSGPADVTAVILNLAGRPVATVLQDRATEAGLRRAVWTGQTLNGTRAPNGQYLLRIAARSADGRQSTALATVPLR